jgi:hypothetical protein
MVYRISGGQLLLAPELLEQHVSNKTSGSPMFTVCINFLMGSYSGEATTWARNRILRQRHSLIFVLIIICLLLEEDESGL